MYLVQSSNWVDTLHIELGFGNQLVLEESKKTGVPGEKALGATWVRISNKLNLHEVSLGISYTLNIKPTYERTQYDGSSK